MAVPPGTSGVSLVADPSSTSIVVPAFNEEAAIGPLVERLRAAGAWHEILVVDDGSTDQTAARAEGAGATVVRHPYNKGNGAAVKSGIRKATGEFILIIDGDGQHRTGDAGRIVSRLGEYDLVIGARSASTQASRARLLGNGALNWLAGYMTGRRVHACASFCTCCRTGSRRRPRRRWPSSRQATT